MEYIHGTMVYAKIARLFYGKHEEKSGYVLKIRWFSNNIHCGIFFAYNYNMVDEMTVFMIVTEYTWRTQNKIHGNRTGYLGNGV